MKNSMFTLDKTEKRIIKTIKSIFLIFKFIIENIIHLIIEAFNIFKNLLKNYKGYTRTGYTNTTLLRMIDDLSPRQFEVFMAELFKSKGYKTTLTAASGDYGRDIILKKNGETTFVECKHYSKSNKVGREICQKILGSTMQFQADKAIVVTTGRFNRNAFEVESMVSNLKLLDREDIMKMILQLTSEEINRIIFKLTNM